QVQALLDALPEDRPLQAVLHLAGVVDDALLRELSPASIEAVFAAKVESARVLDALTRAHPITDFALFSSASGILGAAGQASYAAANATLDALASARRSQGLPALSLAWGPWSEVGMVARLDRAAQARLRRQGVIPLRPEEGLALLDASLRAPRVEATLVPLRLDPRALAEHEGPLPAVLRGLVRPRRAEAE
ncbi:MAG: KR domain-containing protein, partial [Mycobacterium sp.]|nr:KR domain-containing protein [Mycobacterium sp.]